MSNPRSPWAGQGSKYLSVLREVLVRRTGFTPTALMVLLYLLAANLTNIGVAEAVTFLDATWLAAPGRDIERLEFVVTESVITWYREVERVTSTHVAVDFHRAKVDVELLHTHTVVGVTTPPPLDRPLTRLRFSEGEAWVTYGDAESVRAPHFDTSMCASLLRIGLFLPNFVSPSNSMLGVLDEAGRIHQRLRDAWVVEADVDYYGLLAGVRVVFVPDGVSGVDTPNEGERSPAPFDSRHSLIGSVLESCSGGRELPGDGMLNVLAGAQPLEWRLGARLAGPPSLILDRDLASLQGFHYLGADPEDEVIVVIEPTEGDVTHLVPSVRGYWFRGGAFRRAYVWLVSEIRVVR